MRDAFDLACGLVQDRVVSKEERKAAFEAFCELRRRLIAGALVPWLEELRRAAECEAIGRVEPPARWHARTIEDAIRERDVDNRVEDALLDLAQVCNKRGLSRGEQLVLRLDGLKGKAKRKPTELRVLAAGTLVLVVASGDRDRLTALLGSHFPRLQLGASNPSAAEHVLPARGDGSEATAEFLVALKHLIEGRTG
jgi:hypothetical protein